MAYPQWKRLGAPYDGFSARLFQNGRTDIRQESTGIVRRSYSPSLNDHVALGHCSGALSYLFGWEIAENETNV